jgi:hypothetical protein
MEIRIDEQNTRKNSSALGQDRNITEGKKILKQTCNWLIHGTR